MKGKHHSVDQIIKLLKESEEDIASGMTVLEVCRKLGINQGTLWRWRNRYGGMKGEEAKRLKELEVENRRLKKVVTDLELDKAILTEALEGKY